ncbi:hypothetical protein QE152_g30285 [Popillia japonica]|uniref:Uncharacterized protein n=1 Tax=Popillia japonica TaxID=7064 RepID=A0AAW1JF43_POPJA
MATSTTNNETVAAKGVNIHKQDNAASIGPRWLASSPGSDGPGLRDTAARCMTAGNIDPVKATLNYFFERLHTRETLYTT